jgi:serine/threonine protein kinase
MRCVRSYEKSAQPSQIGDSTSFTTAPSSVRWSARELVQSDDDNSFTVLSVSTDSWAFGSLCLEALTGEQPFNHVRIPCLALLMRANRSADPTRCASLFRSVFGAVTASAFPSGCSRDDGRIVELHPALLG